MAIREATDGLLKMVRNYLDITWDDPDGDQKLNGIIARGMAYIDNIAGVALAYETPATEKDLSGQGLLMNYCLYERSDKLNEFKSNYLNELIGLQLLERAYSDD